MTVEQWEQQLLPMIIDNIDLISNNLNEGDTFVDIGANTGLLTKTIIDKLGEGYLSNVILFEPIPLYASECKNKFLNLDNVFVYELALSNQSGSAVIYTSNLNWGYNKIYKEGMEIHPGSQLEVNIERFSDLVDSLPTKKIDFIKIDAEGHDVEVIEGMLEWLSKTEHKPKILFETGWYKEKEQDIINKLIKEFNYELVSVQYDSFLKPKG